MKKILYSLMVCAGAFGFMSCNDSVEDNSRLTYYVVFTLPDGNALDGNAIEHQINTPFVAPEYASTENGEDVKSKVTVKGIDDVDATKIGIYPISYSAENADGFATTATQTVYVVNSAVTTDISGSYTVDNTASTCSDSGLAFENVLSIDIEKIATGIFSVSDFLGGLYDQQEGKGGDYAAAADVNLVQAFDANENSAINFLKSNSIELEDKKSVTVTNLSIASDGGEYTLEWDAAYDGKTFHIVAKKDIEGE